MVYALAIVLMFATFGIKVMMCGYNKCTYMTTSMAIYNLFIGLPLTFFMWYLVADFILKHI